MGRKSQLRVKANATAITPISSTALRTMSARMTDTVSKASCVGMRATTNQSGVATLATATSSSTPNALNVTPVPRQPSIAWSCKVLMPGGGTGFNRSSGLDAATNSPSRADTNKKPPVRPMPWL